MAALGYPGRFAIYDPDLLDPGQLSALDPPDVNATGGHAMPSVQGYSSIVDGRYAAATGSHGASGDGQDTLAPSAVADGVLYFGARLGRERTLRRAHALLLATVFYLPVLLGVMVLDRRVL